MSFRYYIALGDSISIDRYPALDIQEREGLATPPPGLGAASLLYRNSDERWPEFEGRDLATLFPDIRALDLTADGATTASTLDFQIPRLPTGADGPTLVTITAGGNDLISLLDLDVGRPATAVHGEAEEAVDRIAGTLDRIVDEVRDRLEDPTILLGTVYDPSDESGDLGDGVFMPHALGWLARFNRHVESYDDARDIRVIPIRDHFLGHGLSEPDPHARWYWRGLIIEPSARGASEVRRLWLEALEADG